MADVVVIFNTVIRFFRTFDEWVDGWVGEWVDGWVGEWVDGWVDGGTTAGRGSLFARRARMPITVSGRREAARETRRGVR